jgi:hypothetical protein
MTEQQSVASACKWVGTSSIPVQVWSEEDLDERLTAMQTALDKTIEASERIISGSDPSQPDVSAYLEVLQKAPHLIQQESDARLFLRRENGDAVAASRRLLNYWAKRLSIFGADRAYLPLRWFGGAMGQEELEILQTGVFVRLPCDQRGRDVYCLDLSRRRTGFGTASSTLPSRARLFFYLSAQAFSNPKSQSEGIVFLLPITEKSSLSFPNSRAFCDLFDHALPIRVQSVHIACCPPRGTKPLFRDCLIPGYLSTFCDWSENISAHVGKSRDDLVQKLQIHGFQKLGIPKNLGGTWDYQIWIDDILPQLASNNQQATCQRTDREITIDVNDREAGNNSIRTESVYTNASCAKMGQPFKVRAVEQGGSKKEQLNKYLVETCQESLSSDVAQRRSKMIAKNGQERKHPAILESSRLPLKKRKCVGKRLEVAGKRTESFEEPPVRGEVLGEEAKSEISLARKSSFEEAKDEWNFHDNDVKRSPEVFMEPDEKPPAMQKALDEIIAASQRVISGADPSQLDVAAYLEVLQKAPHLIQAESDPRLFLHRENGDAVAASRRLIAYWSKRLKLFGAERAYLPLRLGGALAQEEFTVLRSATFVPLPCDLHGRDVFCLDLSHRRKAFGTSAKLAIRARTVFYLLAGAFSNPKSQCEGIVVLIVLSEKSSMCIPNSADFRDLFRNVLPIRVHSVHIACCPPPGTKPLFTDCLIPNCYKMFDDWCESKNVTTHIGESRDAVSSNLQAYGFEIRGIPERLGGTWDYKLWIDCIMRQAEDIDQHASCQKSGRDKTDHGTETKKPFTNSHLGTSTMAPALLSSTVLGNHSFHAIGSTDASTPFSRPPQVTQAARAGADLDMAGLLFQGELVGLADSADPRSRATIGNIPPKQAMMDLLRQPTHLRVDVPDLSDVPVQNPALHGVYCAPFRSAQFTNEPTISQLLHSIQGSCTEVGNGFANQQLLDLLRPSPPQLQRRGVASTPRHESLFPSAQVLAVTSRNLGALQTQNLHSSTAFDVPLQNGDSNQTLTPQESLFLQLLGSQQLQNPFQRR